MANVWIDENTMGSIGDAIRGKTGGTEKILPAEMPNEIASIVTNPPLQEKSVTSNGEVTADEGYYGLSKVTVNVPTSSGGGGSSSGGTTGATGVTIENGFTVNFYNIDNVLIESHSALFGMWIDEPISYKPTCWRNADGYLNKLPLTINEDEVNSTGIYNLYASLESVISQIYAICGVDFNTYPYLWIMWMMSGTQVYMEIAFGTDNMDTNYMYSPLVGTKIFTDGETIEEPSNISYLATLIEKYFTNADFEVRDSKDFFEGNWRYNYTNFDIDKFSNWYDLREY